MRGYRWDAEAYTRNSSGQLAWARELMGKLALRGDERVLDVGCGDGRVTAELASRVPRGEVVGVDSSEQMIRRATREFPKSSHPNLSFTRMDATSLTFTTRFDVAFSNAALHWVKDQPAMLRGVASSLRPGGRVLFQLGGKGNADGILSILGEMIVAEPWRRYFTEFEFPWMFLAPEDYRALLKTAGFSARRIELIPRDMRHAGRDGLVGWVMTTWMPYTESVPEDFREAFVAEAVDRYLARHPLTSDGAAVVRMVRLEVEAEKAK